jgi:ArsR family transcriptional regulator
LAERLIRREFCVTELAECERESISAESQRSRILRSENIVSRRRRGKHINYALVDQHVADLIANAVLHASEPAARKRLTAPTHQRGDDE